MLELGWLVEGTPQMSRPAVVAVDGVDGSGKTAFAGRLRDGYRERGRSAYVVHLDDFMNPREVRYRQGRASPEGFFDDTYDLEALQTKVLDPLRGSGARSIVLGVFDHRSDGPVECAPVAVSASDVVIVEGLFLHRDELCDRWDVSVFLDVPFEVSVARMAARDGGSPNSHHSSRRRYVLGQQVYFTRCSPRDRATHLIDNR